jgi:hypothetical protein
MSASSNSPAFNITGSNYLQFNNSVTGQGNQIGYSLATASTGGSAVSSALDIVGNGTSNSRTIKLWDNVTVNSGLTVIAGGLTITGGDLKFGSGPTTRITNDGAITGASLAIGAATTTSGAITSTGLITTTGNITTTGTGGITAANGLTVTAGGLTVTAGDLIMGTTPTTRITNNGAITANGITSTTGTINIDASTTGSQLKAITQTKSDSSTNVATTEYIKNLLKFSSITAIPLPVDFTSNILSYNDLTYTVSTSSSYGNNNNAYGVFNTGVGSWKTENNYSDITGLYTGSTITTVLGGSSVLGEWVQIKLPFITLLTKYTLISIDNFQRSSAYIWYVLGSNDGVNFVIIDQRNNYTWSSYNLEITFLPNNNTNNIEYQYYRIVINRNVNWLTTGFDKWGLNISTRTTLVGSYKTFTNPYTRILQGVNFSSNSSSSAKAGSALGYGFSFTPGNSSATPDSTGDYYYAYKALNGNNNVTGWASSGGYDNNGNYNFLTGNVVNSITDSNSSIWKGEYIVLNITSPGINLGMYSIGVRAGFVDKPKNWVVLGYNGSNYTNLDYQTDIVFADNEIKFFTISDSYKNTNYIAYVLLITKINSGNGLSSNYTALSGTGATIRTVTAGVVYVRSWELFTTVQNANIFSHGDLAINNGFIGIGTNSPQFPIHITYAPKTPIYTGWAGFDYNNGNNSYIRTGVDVNTCTSIYTLGSIVSTKSIACVTNLYSSDIRIKNNINLQHYEKSLEVIKNLKPVKFNYIDRFNHGNNITYGFIAQDVEEIIPSLISNRKDYIPSIYSVAKVNNKIITISNDFCISSLKIDRNFECNSIKIRYFDLSNNENFAIIKDIIDDKSFIVEEKINSEKIFIFGHEIENFKSIDTNQIVSLNTASIIELDKQLNETNEKLNEANDKITNLENKLNEILNKLNS